MGCALVVLLPRVVFLSDRRAEPILGRASGSEESQAEREGISVDGLGFLTSVGRLV
jgi:hypothetical protein